MKVKFPGGVEVGICHTTSDINVFSDSQSAIIDRFGRRVLLWSGYGLMAGVLAFLVPALSLQVKKLLFLGHPFPAYTEAAVYVILKLSLVPRVTFGRRLTQSALVLHSDKCRAECHVNTYGFFYGAFILVLTWRGLCATSS